MLWPTQSQVVELILKEPKEAGHGDSPTPVTQAIWEVEIGFLFQANLGKS
jgi:hypothetical protein